MESAKLVTSVPFSSYRLQLILLKREKLKESKPPPGKHWLASLLSLFSARASHVLDREVGLWHPPERRELWLGKWENESQQVR